MLDTITIEADQGVGGKYYLLIIIINGLKRSKFAIRIVFCKDVAHLDIQSLIGFASNEVNLREALLPNMYAVSPAKQLEEHDIFQ
ncbi:hypothetical protein SDC9_176657 [bioreactor metagenome]|uniref:Uncharacterized protein n=1 Tax=bioreactor metagenome TaxID=1076179 RepID=A0A645GSL6_9ZZZZ